MTVPDLVADVREVNRSHAVIETSDALLTRAVDAETGQRAYLLTGEEVFLDPYRGARPDIDAYLKMLRHLTRDDPAQAVRLNTITGLVAARFAQLDTGIALQRREAVGEVASTERLLAGKRVMDQLRFAVAGLHKHERSLLIERQDAEQRSVRNAPS